MTVIFLQYFNTQVCSQTATNWLPACLKRMVAKRLISGHINAAEIKEIRKQRQSRVLLPHFHLFLLHSPIFRYCYLCKYTFSCSSAYKRKSRYCFLFSMISIIFIFYPHKLESVKYNFFQANEQQHLHHLKK